jgi:hypothetical protein
MHRFKSKTDIWLALLIYLSAMSCLFVSAYVIYIEPGVASGLIATFIFLTGFVLPVWLINSTYYVIDGSHLNIKCGPFKWLISLDDITEVTESSSPISGPALSLDRLAIYYGNGRVIFVSPKDKQAFIRALRGEQK